ncbi:MAG: ATP-binding cassette domain-containing protein, partial [Pseudomonadota bacterium]
MLSLKYSGYAPYASIALGTVGGAVIGGPMGAVIGFSGSLSDEIMISNGYYEKHYISTSLYWLNAVINPYSTILSASYPAYKWSINLLSYSSSFAMSYFVDDFIDFKDKINTPLESLLLLNQLFDQKEIFTRKELNRIFTSFKTNPIKGLEILIEDGKGILNNELMRTFLASNALSITEILLVNAINFKLARYTKEAFIPTALAEDTNKQANIAMSVIGLFSLNYLINIISTFFQNGFSKSYNKMIINAVAKNILEKDYGVKLLAYNKQEGEMILKHLTNDIFNLKRNSLQVNDVINQAAGSLVSLHNIITSSPKILLPYSVISLPANQYISKYLIDCLTEISTQETNITYQAQNILEDITKNIEQITLRDGQGFLGYQFNKLWKKLKKLYIQSDTMHLLKNILDNSLSIINDVIYFLYFKHEHSTNKLELDKILPIYFSAKQVNNFLSSNIETKRSNIALMQSKERVKKFFELVNKPKKNANHSFNQEGSIIFSNYSLNLDNQKLVHIEYLKLEPKKHYVITGESGSGKTSVMIDLKSGVVGALTSVGDISLPEGIKIAFLNQYLYIPKSLPLIDVISFPKVIVEEKRSQLIDMVTHLLKELNFYTVNSLNTENIPNKLTSYDFKLSGGQLQKIGIIQAILQQPDILIMDETFVGLDIDSLLSVQNAINKYLPNVTLLAIDHHAHDNNHNNFYNQEIHFTTYSYKALSSLSDIVKYNEIGFYLNDQDVICKTHNATFNLNPVSFLGKDFIYQRIEAASSANTDGLV